MWFSLILQYVANVDGLGTLRILGGSNFRFNKENKSLSLLLELYGGQRIKNVYDENLLSTHVLRMERLRFMVLITKTTVRVLICLLVFFSIMNLQDVVRLCNT
jgi:hypothetical protein